MRKYTLNENFFEKIDTQEKAYWLGFMYADGNCYNNYAKIGLQERDGYILKHFMAALESNQPVHKLNRVKEHHQDISYVTIYSKKLVSDLNKLGCIPNKTKTLTFPDYIIVPQHLMHHFTRGYFDGDGSIWEGQRKIMTVKDSTRVSGYRDRIIHNVKFNITGNLQFITGIRDELVKIGFNSVKININKRIENSASLEYSGRGNMSLFYNYIYNNATIYLNRKKEKFESIISPIRANM